MLMDMPDRTGILCRAISEDILYAMLRCVSSFYCARSEKDFLVQIRMWATKGNAKSCYDSKDQSKYRGAGPDSCWRPMSPRMLELVIA